MKQGMRMVCVLALPAAILSCSGEKAAERKLEEQIEKQTGGQAKVDISKGSYSIKSSKTGEEFTVSGGESVKVPEGFPQDVYVYPGVTVTQSMKQDKFFSLVMNSKDSMQQVVETYRAEMKKQGWTEGTSMENEEQRMLQLEKDGRNVIVGIHKQEDHTMITLQVITEEDQPQARPEEEESKQE